MAESEEGAHVLHFPPLPHPPDPPSYGLDERQETFRTIAIGIVERVGSDLQVSVVNTTSGFPASAVDLGRLKTALESGIAALTMSDVRDRWEDDVEKWLHGVVSQWVQRCKTRTIEPRENGIHVELETQDDLGSYGFSFDVFPGRQEGGEDR